MKNKLMREQIKTDTARKFKKTPAGNIPADWEYCNLGKYIEEVSERNSALKDIPVLSVTNSKGFVNSEDYFDRQVYSKNLSSYKIVREKQFAYNPARVNVGSIAQLENYCQGLLSPMYVVFKVKPGLHPDFLKYWISSQRFKNLVKAGAQGSVRHTLNYSALAEFPFALPSHQEQATIVKVLSTVDMLCLATKTIVSSVQIFKKGVMQELLSLGIPGKHNKYKKSVIGKIPDDWNVVTLGDCARINPEQLGADTDEARIIDYLDISGIPETGVVGQPTRYIFSDAPSRARRVVQAGDILVSTVRPYLRGFAYLETCIPTMIASTGYAVVRPNNKNDARYIYQQILGDRFVEYLMPIMTGSNYPAVGAEDVEKYKFPYPNTQSEREQISRILSGIDARISCESEKLKCLEFLKNALVQDLMNGRKLSGKIYE